MLRSSSLLAAVLAAAAFVRAQAPAATVEKPASIAGVVTNALSGEPILRAHVMVVSYSNGEQHRYGGLTTADGKFSVTGLPAGNYSVSAERVGFVVGFGRIMSVSNVQLKAGDAKDDLQLKLTPTGAILGRVLDADGNPMQDVRLDAEGGGNMYSRGMGNAMTDAKGQFRLGGLAPGRYRVQATVPSMGPAVPEIRTDGTSEVDYAPTYYPNAIDQRGAARVQVQPGADLTGVDIHLQRWNPVRVSGAVDGIPAGTEPNRVQVRASRDLGQGRSMTSGFAIVGADGSFQLWRLTPGKWRLQAIAPSETGLLQSAPVEVEVAETNVVGVQLRLVPPFDVAGQVVFPDGSTTPPAPPPTDGGGGRGGGVVSGALVGRQFGGRSGAPPIQVTLQEMNRFASPRPAQVGPDGTFKLTGVGPGRYRVMVSTVGFVQSLELGSVVTDGAILDLGNGAGGAPLTIRLSNNGADLSGTVSDDKGPVANARVMLVGDDQNMRAMISADRSGVYRFGGLAPGSYKVLALDGDEYPNPADDLDDYGDALASVDLHAGDRATRDIKKRTSGQK